MKRASGGEAISGGAASGDEEYTNLDCLFTSRAAAVVTYLRAKPAWNRTQISLHAAIVSTSWLADRQ